MDVKKDEIFGRRISAEDLLPASSSKLSFMLRRMLAIALLLFPAFVCGATKPNIVLVTISSARADRMGFLGSKRSVTPSLDALARHCIVFEQAYAQAPTTAVSHATILSGTYPQTHHVTEFATVPLPNSLPYLPDVLKSAGYRTGAFAGSEALDPKNGFTPGFDRGFVVYDAGLDAAQSRHSRASQGKEVMVRALAWLEQDSHGPFFLWIQMDADASSGAAYESAISAADGAVGRLITALRTQKLFEGSLVVVTSDHGSSLGAHGEAAHGLFLYDETVHVPLLIKPPQGGEAAQRVRARVPLVNLAPTILEIAGLPVPSQMQGQSLLRIAKGNAPEQPIYSRNDYSAQAFGLSPLESWRAGKFLYIRAPQPELYDLSTDPAAARNLAQTSKGTLETMASQLASFDQHLSSGGGQATALTSSQMQKLASLGYVGLQKAAGTADTPVSGTDPKSATALVRTAVAAEALLGEAKPDKAQVTLEPMMTAAAGMYLAQYVMGVALLEQGKYAQAIPYLHRAIELQANSPWVHYRMGEALLKTRDYQTAAIHLEITGERLPNFAAGHALLAQVYDHLGKSEDAKRERTKAMLP